MSSAAFIDLNCMRAGSKMLDDALNRFDGEITLCKLYNYDDRRRDFDGFIARRDAATAPLSNGRKRVRLDMRLALDAVAAAERLKPEKILLVCGELELPPLLDRLKLLGVKTVVAAEGKTLVNGLADEVIILRREVELEVSDETDAYNAPPAESTAIETDAIETAAIETTGIETPPIETAAVEEEKPDRLCGARERAQRQTADNREKGLPRVTAKVSQRAIITEKLAAALAASRVEGAGKEALRENLDNIKASLLKLLAEEKRLKNS